LKHAVLHDDDRIGQRHRLDLIVGHDDGGALDLVMHALDFLPQGLAHLAVQVGQRFVKQQKPRLSDNGPRDVHALLLSAGEHAWLQVEELIDLEQRRHSVYGFLYFFRTDTLGFQIERRLSYTESGGYNA
jgi:hypothetical protein